MRVKAFLLPYQFLFYNSAYTFAFSEFNFFAGYKVPSLPVDYLNIKFKEKKNTNS